MSNYTKNCYEIKRNLMNFSKKVSKELSKPDSKFIDDSDITKSLREEI